jgi:ubiquitin carboxyl-terminal hydrolase 22/27/51
MNFLKNDALVHYPVDDLCLNGHSSLYTLYSVINHNGVLDNGHYTTFARDISADSKLWFEFDDEIINQLTIDRLNYNPNAYLLFYISKQTS